MTIYWAVLAFEVLKMKLPGWFVWGVGGRLFCGIFAVGGAWVLGCGFGNEI